MVIAASFEQQRSKTKELRKKKLVAVSSDSLGGLGMGVALAFFFLAGRKWQFSTMGVVQVLKVHRLLRFRIYLMKS